MLAAMKLLIFDMISIGRLRRTCRPVGLEAQPGWLVGWSVDGGVVCCSGWCAGPIKGSPFSKVKEPGAEGAS